MRRLATSLALTTVLAVPAAGAQSASALPTSSNGQAVELVASGLRTPTSFAFGDGTVFEGDGGTTENPGPPNGGVYVLKSGTATEIPGSPGYVAGLAWHGGALYISGGTLTSNGLFWQLYKWTGWNGHTFKTHKTIYTGPEGFDGFNGLAFGPHGRLYVGVDVGMSDGNDHGPPGTSPYVYDILTFNAKGKELQVFATGIRQPWQLAFPAHSTSPYVTVLSQDSGATNPPDFILRVTKGQNYGYPTCNQTEPSPCTGFAKPFEEFEPHDDLMGIAISGSSLYVTSFAGPGALGWPDGEVFTLPASGGPLQPMVTGFTAPTVGLAINGGYLYVGELSGEVFRVKV
jgi:hypothetical protein